MRTRFASALRRLPRPRAMNGDAPPNRWLKSKTVGVISAAFSGGQRRAGVDRGPQQLVDAGLLTDIEVRSSTLSRR